MACWLYGILIYNEMSNTITQTLKADGEGEVRTSITLPRELLKKAKVAAVRRNESLQQVCTDALRVYLATLDGDGKVGRGANV
jgi:hypothetical protein